ncbi:MAG: tetratricopeptide repeat protein [Desulfobacterales bacterium]|nr:tetratricopeptide repeat protein [Desulfobacterales bacterium]MBS3755196.1 tetratricopeptide repeat protein [Desulfobacterales bacterium]
MKHRILFKIIAGAMMLGVCWGCGAGKGPSQEIQRAEAARNLGEAYMADGNYTKALRELLKAEQMHPEDPYLHNDLGLTYMGKDRPEKAAAHFKKALDLKPDYSPARNNLGSAYVALEQWDKAISCFKEVNEDLLYMTPQYPLSNLGYVYYKKGAYHKAEQYYLEALNLKHDFSRALHGLGQVYIATGDYDKAIKRLKKATEKAPQAAEIHMDLARAYTKTHHYNKAVQIYKKAADIAGDSPLGEKAEAQAEAVLEMW